MTLSALCSSPPPKIVFNRLNGKRYHSAAAQKTTSPAEGFTPAHEENVRFVYEGEGDGANPGTEGPPLRLMRSEVARMKTGSRISS